MTSDLHAVPRIGVQGVAGGLLLMAFFTILWGSWSLTGLPLVLGVPIIAVFVALAILFAIGGIRLFGLARHFPRVDTSSRQARTKSFSIRFGVVFGTEGLTIGAASGALVATGLSDFINPVIALIVGLHFIPLARIFERTIDYYIAAWVVVVALVGIGLLAFTSTPVQTVWAIVSLGTACGTSVFGLYMMGLARGLRRRVPPK